MTIELVSIVTPSLNHGKFISEAIQSVLSQNFPSLEYWVIDGGSSDETIEILNQFSGQIKWFSGSDAGLYDAVNKGWANSRGRYVGFLNADDLLCPGALQQLVTYLEKNPEVALVYGDYYRVDQDGKILERVWAGKADINTLLKHGNTIFTGAALFRRSVLEKIGWFNSTLRFSSDYDLCIRIAQHSPIAHIPQPLAMFRMHTASKSQNSKWKMWKEALEISYKYSGRRYFSLYSRYLVDRFVHALPQPLLWKSSLLHFRKRLRRLWKLGG